MLDMAVVKASMPSTLRSYVTPEFMDKLNNISVDPIEAEELRESAIGYIDILQSGKYKMDSYLNAIKYVTYMALGSKSIEAWAKVFPEKYARCVAQNMPEKTIHSYVSHYKSSKLVTELMERMMVPTHILNAPFFQEAINKSVDLMRNAKSERIQLEAATSLLVHLKRPETQKLEIDVGIKENSQLQELKDITMGLAAQQQQLIAAGAYSPKDVAHQRITIEHKADADE